MALFRRIYIKTMTCVKEFEMQAKAVACRFVFFCQRWCSSHKQGFVKLFDYICKTSIKNSNSNLIWFLRTINILFIMYDSL